MVREWQRIAAAIALAAMAVACAPTQPAPTKPPQRAVLSLDWVPNTNHTGLYVAMEKGYYKEQGLAVEIVSPADPAAALRAVAAGQTHFGVSFQEEVTVSRANGIPVVSIAAILQHNTSAFAALADTGLSSPKDWEGKRYGSYGLPLEPPVIEGLMECAGADFSQVEFVDVGFDAYPALVNRQVDFIWIFQGWDGIQAELQGVELSVVPLMGSCIPDYYTPVLIAGETTLSEQPDLVGNFLAATTRGYEYAIEHPAEAAEILLQYAPESDAELVRRSQAWLSPYYQAEAAQWGVQRGAVWADFAEWMNERGLLPQMIDSEQAYTNEFLP